MAIVNTLLWTLRCMYIFELVFFLGIYPGVELLGHMEFYLLFFEKSLYYFPQWLANLHSPQQYRRGFFPLLHPDICYLCYLWWQPFWQVWGGISLWFCFAFPWRLARLNILGHVHFLVVKNDYSVLAIFKSGWFLVFFFFFLCQIVMSCLYMLEISSLLVISFARNFSHSLGCLFLVDGFLCSTKA